MGPGLLATINQSSGRAAQWAAIALGFSIPISTALDNLLLAVLLAGWLASGAWREKWDAVHANRVALAALVLYALLLAGTLYGAATPGDARVTLGKYLDLLWIPVLAWLFREAAARRRALYALAVSLALVLLTSFLLMADLLPHASIIKGDSVAPFVMKTRQTHGLLMAFGAFLFLQLAVAAAAPRMRILWSVLALLAVANATLVVPGATGYIVLGTLALYIGYVWKGWRGIAVATGAVAGAVAVLMTVPGPFQERVLRIESEIRQWQPGIAEDGSSAGQRIEFYRVSLQIVKDRPLLGHGTGSFTIAYAEKMKGQQAMLTRNPHNEYLHWMVQLGLAGLAGLLYLFWTHWRLAPNLASPLERHLARGLILTMAVGCLFNSWLMDHTEGLLFVWLTGLLFAGLKSPELITRHPSPVTGSG
ncbi:MAG TPA: O-antigen ligase family protein [Burkholderiales bacterium]